MQLNSSPVNQSLSGCAGEPIDPQVLLICPNLGPGGTQRVVSTLANAWAARDNPVAVMTIVNDPDFYTLDHRVPRIRLRVLRVRRLAQWLGRVCKVLFSPLVFSRLYRTVGHWILLITRVRPLRRAIADSGAKVVISFIGSVNIITILACRRLNVRVVVSERNDPARQRLQTPWQYLRPRLYGRADLVTANSQGALDHMSSYVDADRLRYLPNPLVVRESIDAREVKLAEGALYFLVVARLDPQKAHDVLLRAFSNLPPRLDKWRLAVAGTGDEGERLRQLCDELGIEERVDWLGQIENPFSLYRQTEVLVLPSLFEGLPNAVIEAMSEGLPVIVSDGSPGPLELVTHNKTGVVAAVGDVDALTEAMTLLADEPDRRRRLGEAARERVRCFHLQQVLMEWETLINQQIEQGKYNAT